MRCSKTFDKFRVLKSHGEREIENHKTVYIISHRAVHRLDGRRVFNKSGARHIASCVAAVFGVACQRSAELRRLAECFERNTDNRAGDIAAQKKQAA